MEQSIEIRKKKIIKIISHISRPDWIEKLEAFVNSLESTVDKVEEQ